MHSNIVHSPRPNPNAAEVTFTAPEEIYSVLALGESLEHPFVHDPAMGINWKLWPMENAQEGGAKEGPVQSEYMWVPDARKVWWDLSMIDAGGRVKRRHYPGVHGNGESEFPPQQEEEDQDAEPEGETEASGAHLPGVTHPFAAHGLSLQPQRNGQPVVHVDAAGGTAVGAGVCTRIDCPAGEDVCRQAYNA